MATSSIHRPICIINESYQEALKTSLENEINIDERFNLKSVKTATDQELLQIAEELFDWS